MLLKITPDNKGYVVRRYVDYIVSRMDSTEILDSFKSYLYNEKMGYPIDTLELEINRHCPEILQDHTAEQLVGKGKEYAKTIF